jgi:hypothetical protein
MNASVSSGSNPTLIPIKKYDVVNDTTKTLNVGGKIRKWPTDT